MKRALLTSLLLPFISLDIRANNPLRVFILCGQSNMEGHAKISTFEAMKHDPLTKPIYQQMVDQSGNPVICDEVWISNLTGGSNQMGESHGKLTTGYGSRRDPTQRGEKIGPEFTFGIYANKLCKEPILIIKTAWGGKSLHTDFRSPSAGPYQFNESEIERIKKQGKDLEKEKAKKSEETGRYYHLMINHVKKVLSDVGRVYPNYDAKKGFEITGFVWFQGWNDMVDGGVYPDRGKPGGYDQYSDCLSHFIRDVKKDLKSPKMKFVIGVMGVGGPLEEFSNQRYLTTHKTFREAMAGPASIPEFEGKVIAVQTAGFWDMRLKELEEKQEKINQLANFLRTRHQDHPNHDGQMSESDQKKYLETYRNQLITEEEGAYLKIARSNAAYHYFGSAKTMAQIGKAFAEAMF